MCVRRLTCIIIYISTLAEISAVIIKYNKKTFTIKNEKRCRDVKTQKACEQGLVHG